MLGKILKEPLVQFLLIGVCIYAAYALFAAPDEAEAQRTVYISEDRIASLAAAWEKRWNRPPTQQELTGLVRAWVREDILYKEALNMGLDNDDHIIRRRLAQKIEFLTSDLAQLAEPAPGELEEFFAANIDQFRAPDRISFVQVFFNPDARGDATISDAEQTLAELRAAGVPDPATLEAGDRLMLNSFYNGATELDVRRAMGTGFAEAIMQLEPGQWHGPVLSGFGTHLVYIYEIQRAPDPQLEEVRAVVLAEWQRIKTEQINDEFFAIAKSRYEIVIEAPEELVDEVLREDSAEEIAIPDGAAGS